eukprot:scaffold174715_cov29-Tisochrysis_lutea.AAC.3
MPPSVMCVPFKSCTSELCRPPSHVRPRLLYRQQSLACCLLTMRLPRVEIVLASPRFIVQQLPARPV